MPNRLASAMAVTLACSLPCSPSPSLVNRSPDGFNQLASGRCGTRTKVASVGRQQMLPATCLFRGPCASGDIRIFVVSDLHTDYGENMEWLKRLPTVWHKGDVLIVAGDVAETISNFVLTMSQLKERFGSIFYVPGNHDLWCRREDGKFTDSLDKLSALLETCNELGVQTAPKIMGSVGIIPLFSWYHKSFDTEKDINSVRIPSLEMVCKDFHACKWPSQLSSDDVALAHFFDTMNEKNHEVIQEIQKNCCQLITFSHFVPRQDLCPEKRMLFYPNLPKIIGSDFLEARIRSIHGENKNKSGCHIFGHTHFCWDAVHDGIRYVQAPLAYPRERKRRMNGGEDWLPFCIYHKGFTDRLSPSYWSDYYSINKRDPDNTDLAPWVARFYRSSNSSADGIKTLGGVIDDIESNNSEQHHRDRSHLHGRSKARTSDDDGRRVTAVDHCRQVLRIRKGRRRSLSHSHSSTTREAAPPPLPPLLLPVLLLHRLRLRTPRRCARHLLSRPRPHAAGLLGRPLPSHLL